MYDNTNYIWHPFTQHATEPCAIKIHHAKNASLFTDDNFEIIDCISSWWTITHGHNHPVLNQALKTQIDNLSHVMFAGFTHQPALDLSQALMRAVNHQFDKVFFADNGSGAIEVALKMSYQYHYNAGNKDKTIFLALEGAYHGDTFGAMATGRTTGFYTPFEPFLCDVKFIPYPDTYYHDDMDILTRREQESLHYFSQLIDKYHEKIACLILEPLMQGAKGMRFCRPEFVKKLCDMARSADILVIFDEVATGFGRTGTLFAFEQIGFVPDFLCLSKGLTAGYMPLSVTLTHKKIYNAFLGGDFKNAFTHGHSFTANPLACAVAAASLKLFETQPLDITVVKIQDLYQDIIKTLATISSVTKIRTLGTVLAWDLKIADADYKSKTSEILKDKCLEMGLNIRPLGKTFYLLPPYCITKQQIDYIITCIKQVFL